MKSGARLVFRFADGSEFVVPAEKAVAQLLGQVEAMHASSVPALRKAAGRWRRAVGRALQAAALRDAARAQYGALRRAGKPKHNAVAVLARTMTPRDARESEQAWLRRVAASERKLRKWRKQDRWN